tara:strand:- start:1871 stop:2824 length:954 start_codon:yes stop_codon:yes gene_type:complete
MGTAYHIAWVGQQDDAASLKAEVDSRLAAINRIMSTYDPASELSLINQGKAATDADGWIPVSADLAEVLADSLTIYTRSDGLFDISVGPLVNLWGFGPDARYDEVPSAEALQQAMNETGLNALQYDADKPAIRLNGKRYLDLSAIAKGWAVDDIAEHLEAHDIHNYMVEIGGEIRTAGSKPGQAPWRIAIERPGALTEGRSAELVIEPGNAAVATSGDYRNYFEQDGVRYSHTINPFTGRPVTHRLASVTVINESSAMADGWATALNVAGPDKGMALAEQYQLAVFMIVRSEDGFIEKASPAFRKAFMNSEQPDGQE